MSLSKQEGKAVSRWRPPVDTPFNRLLTAVVVTISRFIMKGMNSLTIEGADRFEALLSRGDRGLLTFGNHVSLFDDPLLLSNLHLPRYRDIRWVAADALNFFGSPWKAFIFRAGKCVPIVRGAGLDQQGFDFLRDRLAEGGWVHIFPEGGRTRDQKALLSQPFKAGIGRLMAETRPLALPFYHYGMHEVLPLGAKFPRFRRPVRFVFGDAIDCDELMAEVAVLDGGQLSGPRLWEAITTRTYEVLRELEMTVNPAARLEPESGQTRV